LVGDAQQALQEMGAANKQEGEALGTAEASVDSTVAELEISGAELDAVEHVAGNELDALMLEQAEDLAGE
jgi:hypothetical protein